MELHYLGNIRLPTEKAHGLQIVQNCEALAAHADVTLYPARRRQDPALHGVDPWDHYGVARTFAIRYVPIVDLMPLTRGREDLFGRAGFHLQTATYNLGLRWMLRHAASDAAYYSRQPMVLAALRRFKPARRLFWEAHSLPDSLRKRQALADLVGGIGGAVTVTDHLAGRLVELGVPQDRLLVAPDGFRAARFAGAPSQAEARAARGLPPDAFIVGYMGRLHTLNMGKGVDDLVAALTLVDDRPVHLMLVGGPADMVETYRRQWIDHGLPPDRFHCLGQVPAPDVPGALAAFDVAAMPFPWTEHFAYYASPIKLFEYMAGGRAILATDLPSTTSIVADGETALLVPPSDPAALAAAVVRLYDDPGLRARLAENARQLVYARYTWAARAAGIVDFIAARVEG